MYSLHFYGELLTHGPRTDAHVAALKQAVKPDSVVLDLGCGPGLFALLACKFGARRAYGIEPDNTINLAREAAAANGFADRIEFFQDLSTNVTLPERATIIIFDLRGVLPWFMRNIPTMIDARERLLAPGGMLIPRRDLAWATIVDDEAEYQQIVGPWDDRKFGVDLSAGLSRITNCWRKTRIKASSVLSEPVCWAKLDYREVTDTNVRSDISLIVNRSGTAHGIAVWFDAELTEDTGFSNHPAAAELVYGQAFLPFTRPVEVRPAERVKVTLRADYIQNDYVWTWETNFTKQKIEFKQSTFYGVPLSTEQLRKTHAQ